MSKNILRGSVSAQCFSQSILPISELPPAGLRKGGRVAEIVRRQREDIRRAAYEEGYAEGCELGSREGFAEAKKRADERYSLEIEAFVQRLHEVESRFESTVAEFLDDAAEQLAAIAVVVAEKLLRLELREGKEAAVAIAKEAIREVRHGASVRIRVNPFDSGEVSARQSEILAAAQGLRSIEIVRDPSIQGGCVIESDDGVIDARIEAALERIVAAARQLRHESGFEQLGAAQ